MAKTPATVIAEINQYIIANGVGAISGPVLNGVLQDLCNLVPPTPLDSGLMGYDSSGNPLAVSGGGGGGTPGGTNGQLQYNNSGSFGGYGVGTGLSVVGGNLTATGAGGGGITVATSLAALQALTGSAGAVAYLEAGARSGFFVWSTANLSTAVTNDPSQGIYVVLQSFTVSGTLTPNLVGTYVLGGTYQGSPYYVCPSVGYIWYDAASALWSINPELGSLTGDGFFQGTGSNPISPPTGTYNTGGLATGTATVTFSGVTGSAGGWVRQYEGRADFGWWGTVLDATYTRNDIAWTVSAASGTDNYSSALGWWTWAQWQSSLGIPVYMSMTPQAVGSVFGWHLAGPAGGYYWFANIKDLDIDFMGCTMQQLTNAAQSAASFPIAAYIPFSTAYLINQTTPQIFIFSLVTAAQISNLSVDQWIMLASFDLQRTGFPPNPYYYQFVQISALNSYATASAASATYNSGTGIFTLTFSAAPFGAGIGTGLNGLFITVSSSGVSALNGNWEIGSTASAGTVVNLFATVGLGALSPTGGTIPALGVVTISQPILDIHSPNYPDYNGSGFPCGAARIFILDYSITGLISKWDIRHTYRNVVVNLPPNNAPPGNYSSMTGNQITLKNWRGTGLSPTTLNYFRVEDSTECIGGEFDKMIFHAEYVRMNSPNVGLNIQSAAPRVLIVDGGYIRGIGGSGQRLYVRGTTITTFVDAGCIYGLTGRSTYESCIIGSSQSFGSVLDGALLWPIDGTIITYDGNGVITLHLTATGGPAAVVNWSIVPGMVVALQAIGSDSSTMFPGNIGVGIVMSVTTDSQTSPTVLHFNTTLPFSTLPSWASRSLYQFHAGPTEMRDCTGNDQARMASDAKDAGKLYYNWHRINLAGNTALPYATTLQTGLTGALISVSCNVLSAHPTSGATLVITFNTYDSSNSFLTDTGGTVVTFNIGVPGNRVVNLAGFSGKAGTDALTVGGAAATALAPNRITWIYNAAITAAGSTWTDVELIVETDNGMARKTVTSTALLPVVGSLQ